VSLAVKYDRAKEFSEAGYTPIISDIGVGGQVRQFGNFSFSRVYQAGHEGGYFFLLFDPDDFLTQEL
jgi:hypothetical protein